MLIWLVLALAFIAAIQSSQIDSAYPNEEILLGSNAAFFRFWLYGCCQYSWALWKRCSFCMRSLLVLVSNFTAAAVVLDCRQHLHKIYNTFPSFLLLSCCWRSELPFGDLCIPASKLSGKRFRITMKLLLPLIRIDFQSVDTRPRNTIKHNVNHLRSVFFFFYFLFMCAIEI